MDKTKKLLPKIILSLLMAGFIYFFTISLRQGSLYAWIYGIFLFGLFIKMLYSKKINKYRRIFQFTFAILFIVSFVGNLYDERGSMAITQNAMVENEIPFCHLVIPLAIIPYIFTKTIIFPARLTGHYAAIASMLAIWFTATVTIGRGWCSWACFYGGIEDGISGIGKKQRLKLLPQNKNIRAFHFGFLIFLILTSLAAMSSVFCQWFCPFKLVTEFNQIVDIPSLIGTFVFMSVFLIFIIVLPFMTKKRTQCSMICPFGAMQSILDKIGLYKLVIDTEKCISCMKCANVCPFFAIDIDTILEKKGQPEITCAKCGACIDICPENAIRIDFTFNKNKNLPEPKKLTGKLSWLKDLIMPQNFFIFSAFTFGVVISSNLAIDGLRRIAEGLMHIF